MAFFENLPNNHNPGIFFQTLANCIRNNVLSHQATIYKLRKENKSRLNKRILELKKNFDINNMEILRNERILSSVIEQELKDELLHYGGYELLNNEKITSHFMNLVKIARSTDSID